MVELGVLEAEAIVVVVVAPARLTFHPTTAIAPTLVVWVKVVVTIVQLVDAVIGVDAYVKVIPGNTCDQQSPTTWPLRPFAS